MRLHASMVGACLVLGLAGERAPAQGRGDSDSQGNWLTRLFAKKPAPENLATPPSVEVARQSTVKAQQDWDRRIKLCDKLRAVANQSGDDELLRQADQLEMRAWDAYQAQLKKIALGRQALTPEEQAIDGRVGPNAAGGPARPDTSPFRSMPASSTPGSSSARRR